MKKIIYIGILFLGFLSSCGDDFVEIENQNGISESNFLQTANQAHQASVSMYHPISNHGLYRMGFLIFGDVTSDNIDNGGYGTGGLGNAINSMSNYTWDGSNKFFVNIWNASYQGIARANYLISKIDQVEDISDDLYNQYLGEAYFMRAFYHYHLAIGFDEIPVVTSVLTSTEANTVTKSSKEEVFAQIVSDFKRASELLPKTPANSAEVGRATKGAALAFLSRVYLWTGDYQDAVDAADAVDDLGKYSLVSSADYLKMFDGRMENSSESIMEAQFVSGFNYWSEDEAETSQMQNMFPRVSWARYFTPRKSDTYSVVDSFEPGDIRREASILIAFEDMIEYPDAGVTSLFPDASILGGWNSNYDNETEDKGNLQIRKYLPHNPTEWGGPPAPWQFTDVNIPIIRYAEVLLNKAEAYIQLDDVVNARAALELVRARAGLTMTGVPNDVDGVFEQIKIDRRNELMFEGHRWFDIKRWDDFDVLQSAGTNYTGQKVWPIPTVETDINPNL
ncbi:RagB/SusD family nutrient uptake outer membrane protein [Wenyingzhuangia sp. IMCC45574]